MWKVWAVIGDVWMKMHVNDYVDSTQNGFQCLLISNMLSLVLFIFYSSDLNILNI